MNKTKSKREEEIIKRNIGMYGLGGLFFIASGIMFLLFHLSIHQQEFMYSDGISCPSTEIYCEMNITITAEMNPPIFVYYQVRQLWINNWGFINSKNIDQLQGKNLSVSQLDSCEPYIRNKDFGYNESIDGSYLDPEGPANPCGLAAALYFNGNLNTFTKDTFEIVSVDTDTGKVEIIENGIVFDFEREMFSKPQNSNQTQWTDNTNGQIFL